MSNQYIPDGYKPPINITEEFTNPIIQEHDNQIMSQIKMVVDVDKQELIKALNYDRHQYECGYRAAVKKFVRHGHWKKSEFPSEKYCCSVCGAGCWYYDYEGDVARSRYCPQCGARMDESEVE